MVPASVRAGGYCDGDENENENDGAESTKTKKRRSGGVADVGGAPLSAHTHLSSAQFNPVQFPQASRRRPSDRMRSASKRLVLVTPRAFRAILCPSSRTFPCSYDTCPWFPRSCDTLPILPDLSLLL